MSECIIITGIREQWFRTVTRGFFEDRGFSHRATSGEQYYGSPVCNCLFVDTHRRYLHFVSTDFASGAALIYGHRTITLEDFMEGMNLGIGPNGLEERSSPDDARRGEVEENAVPVLQRQGEDDEPNSAEQLHDTVPLLSDEVREEWETVTWRSAPTPLQFYNTAFTSEGVTYIIDDTIANES